jgi:hypothetical protein
MAKDLSRYWNGSPLSWTIELREGNPRSIMTYVREIEHSWKSYSEHIPGFGLEIETL